MRGTHILLLLYFSGPWIFRTKKNFYKDCVLRKIVRIKMNHVTYIKNKNNRRTALKRSGGGGLSNTGRDFSRHTNIHEISINNIVIARNLEN